MRHKGSAGFAPLVGMGACYRQGCYHLLRPSQSRQLLHIHNTPAESINRTSDLKNFDWHEVLIVSKG